MKAALRGLGLLGPLIVLCASCDERFEFERPEAAGAGGAATAGASPLASSGGVAAGGAAGGGAAGGAGVAGSGGAAGASGQGGASGAAGGCGQHGPCPGTQRCIDGECYQCELDADCTETSFGRCHPERHRCVECVAPGECPDDFWCDFRTNRCVHLCRDEMDCPDATPGCDGGFCFGCYGDYDCEQSPLGQYCAADRSGCVHCRDADDCPHLCDKLVGRCVDCLDGGDCVSGFCDSVSGLCLN